MRKYKVKVTYEVIIETGDLPINFEAWKDDVRNNILSLCLADERVENFDAVIQKIEETREEEKDEPKKKS